MTLQEIEEATEMLRTRLDESMIAGVDEITARATILQVELSVQVIRLLMKIHDEVQRVEGAVRTETEPVSTTLDR